MKKNFKNTDNQTVSISRNELSILTARLFSDNGNNVSPIIEDLARGGMPREIAELKTALLYVAPNSDAVTGGPWIGLPRANCYESYYDLYLFESYSYLTNMVKYVRVNLTFHKNENGERTVTKSWVEHNTTDLNNWLSREVLTDVKLLPKHLRDKYRGLIMDYVGSTKEQDTSNESEETWEF